MAWEIEYTDEFERWWDSLSEAEQESIAHDLEILRKVGPSLGRPHVDTIHGSKFDNMKELRTTHRGVLYRTLFAFDPRRTAILPIGGPKSGDSQWYKKYIRLADRLCDEHLDQLRREGLL